MAELTPRDIERVKRFLDSISPEQERPPTVLESGVGGPGVNIPLYRLTDSKFFPRYQFSEYPKSLNRSATEADVSAFAVAHRFVDTGSRELSYTRAPLQLGQLVPYPATQIDVAEGYAEKPGDGIVFKDAEHEAKWYARNTPPEMPKPALSVSDLVTNGDAPPRRRRSKHKKRNVKAPSKHLVPPDSLTKEERLAWDKRPAAEQAAIIKRELEASELGDADDAGGGVAI
jgi:hypothetical protein